MSSVGARLPFVEPRDPSLLPSIRYGVFFDKIAKLEPSTQSFFSIFHFLTICQDVGTRLPVETVANTPAIGFLSFVTPVPPRTSLFLFSMIVVNGEYRTVKEPPNVNDPICNVCMLRCGTRHIPARNALHIFLKVWGPPKASPQCGDFDW